MGIFDKLKKKEIENEQISKQEDVKEDNITTELAYETNSLCKFGKLLITQTRDMTINNMKKRIYGTMRGNITEEIQEKLKGFTEEQKQTLEYIISQTVDNTLHNLLWMVEENDEIELNYKGENLKEISDGLCGELYSEDGWIQKYTSYNK